MTSLLGQNISLILWFLLGLFICNFELCAAHSETTVARMLVGKWQQMRLGKYQDSGIDVCVDRRRQKRRRSTRVVLYGDIRFRFNKCQQGFWDCYTRNLQQCQQEEGPQPPTPTKLNWPSRMWIQAKANPTIFFLFQMISFIQKQYKFESFPSYAF